MNTKLIGFVSVALAMAVLLLTSWGATSARGEDQWLLHHVRPLAFEANRGRADEQVKFLARSAGDYVFDNEGRVRVRLGAYDVTRPVVIDPVLAYATYLGGSNDEADGLWGAVFGIPVDAAGNTYVTGSTTSVDFPTTPGATRTLSGSQDAFVRPPRHTRDAEHAAPR